MLSNGREFSRQRVDKRILTHAQLNGRSDVYKKIAPFGPARQFLVVLINDTMVVGQAARLNCLI